MKDDNIPEDEPLQRPTWKDLKDAYLSKKQGEALERITVPRKHYEGLGLGHFGPQTVLALASVDLLEDVVNELAYKPTITEKIFDEDGKEIGTKEVDVPMLPSFEKTLNSLHIFTETVGVASGSRNAIRMEKALETIGNLGQYKATEGFSGDMTDEAEED